MKIRPCIDLHGGAVKQIVGSSLNDSGVVENFVSQHAADYFAELYKKDNLSGGHVIMLGPGNAPQARLALQSWPDHLQVGGGITVSSAAEWIDQGAQAVIVTSAVFKNGTILWDQLQQLIRAVGVENIVLDVSCKKFPDGYHIMTDRWQTDSAIVVEKGLLEKLAAYCFEFLVHAVDVEGKKAGPDTALLELLCQSPLPVTYAGGISSLSDLDKINTITNGAVDVTIGSALDIFGGKVSYEAVVQWHKRQNTPGDASS